MRPLRKEPMKLRYPSYSRHLRRPHIANHIHTMQPVEAGGTIVLQRLVSYKKLQQARSKFKRAQLRYLRHAKANTYNTK